MPFLGIPWSNLNAQISPDELQNVSLSQNAQNMALLHAATNSDPYLSKGDIVAPTLVDSQALLHDNTPLAISKSVASSSVEDMFVSESSDQISVYVVHDGDTLPAIARMFNVSPNTIRWANNLDTKTPIKKDMQLVILPISGVKYVVKKGDTVKSIAEKYKGDVDEIISFNGIDSSLGLTVGDEIIIPNGEVNTVTSSAGNNSSTKMSGVKNLASKGVNNGYFMRPIIGGIKTQGIHGHNGVDLASSYGSSILAAASGQVIIAKQGGWNGGYGSYVVIKHGNGTQTLYGHLSSVKVSPGQSVSKGDVIGGMGSTGDSTGVHLHFEVRGGVNPF